MLFAYYGYFVMTLFSIQLNFNCFLFLLSRSRRAIRSISFALTVNSPHHQIPFSVSIQQAIQFKTSLPCVPSTTAGYETRDALYFIGERGQFTVQTFSSPSLGLAEGTNNVTGNRCCVAVSSKRRISYSSVS